VNATVNTHDSLFHKNKDNTRIRKYLVLLKTESDSLIISSEPDRPRRGRVKRGKRGELK
jgi:hypothetical protein